MTRPPREPEPVPPPPGKIDPIPPEMPLPSAPEPEDMPPPPPHPTGPPAPWLLSDPERRRIGGPLLLRFPVFGGCRSGPVESGQRAAKEDVKPTQSQSRMDRGPPGPHHGAST